MISFGGCFVDHIVHYKTTYLHVSSSANFVTFLVFQKKLFGLCFSPKKILQFLKTKTILKKLNFYFVSNNHLISSTKSKQIIQ